MASKRKQPSKQRNPCQIRAKNSTGEDPALMLAQTVLRPSVQGATTLGEYNKSLHELDLHGLIEALGAQIKAINDGDLSRAEAMLTTQAHTLDGIFNNLARRAINAEYMNNLECYLKLALRAQSQCRATWEAVATIKNPPVVGYVNQANIAHGPQQVTNATKQEIKVPRAQENEIPQNELLEHKHGQRLDFGAKSQASDADTAMATVGVLDRPKNTGG